MKKFIILPILFLFSCKIQQQPSEVKFVCTKEEFNLAIDKYYSKGYKFYNAYDIDNNMIKVIMKK